MSHRAVAHHTRRGSSPAARLGRAPARSPAGAALPRRMAASRARRTTSHRISLTRLIRPFTEAAMTVAHDHLGRAFSALDGEAMRMTQQFTVKLHRQPGALPG